MIITRKEAIQQNFLYYFTGIPCKKGHLSNRRTKNCVCVSCDKEYKINNSIKIKQQDKQYYIDNKDILLTQQLVYQTKNKQKIQDYVKQYYLDNKNKYIKRGRQYYINNPEYYKEHNKQWNLDNPHKIAEYSRLRSNKLEQSIPSWYEEELVKQLYLKRDELNEKWGTTLTVDHIIPLNPICGTVSGLHCWHNLQLLDKSLNSIKGSNYQTDW